MAEHEEERELKSCWNFTGRSAEENCEIFFCAVVLKFH